MFGIAVMMCDANADRLRSPGNCSETNSPCEPKGQAQCDGCEMTCFHDEALEKEMAGTMPGTVPSRSDLRLTTVGEQLDAIHETRVVRGQEERRSGNFFRLADTTHRHL